MTTVMGGPIYVSRGNYLNVDPKVADKIMIFDESH